MGERTTLSPPRAVLDTNCVVSALLFAGGRLAGLRQAWQAGHFIPVVSRDTVSELIRVLNYPKFKLTPTDQKTLLADFLPYTETYTTHATNAGVPDLRDPDDAVFVALAFQAATDVLASGDDDLLAARTQLHPLTILAPYEFQTWLHAREQK